MPRYRFLGQDINIGKFTGFTNGRTAVEEVASSFSILGFFREQIEEGQQEAVAYCHDSNGDCIFAIAYNNNGVYGYTTFLKWATTLTGFISETDKPPQFAPWNNWIIIGTFDPDNISIAAYADNSFGFYEAEQSLYPYWYGFTGENITFNQVARGANIYICTALKNYDGTQVVNYTGPTPLLEHGGVITNWIDNNDVTDPSYFLDGLGLTEVFIYNPLFVVESKIIDNSEDDDSTTGGSIGGVYGWEGGNVWFNGPIALSAIDTGLLTLFSPNQTETRALANYLWNDSSFITSLQKLWTEPMDAIISFGILPVNLNSIKENAASHIYIGNIDTGLDAYKLTSQYIQVDFGSVSIEESFANALDYEPFTKAQMYLPAIGFVPLKLNEIMRGKIFLQYWIDVLSGDCVAQIGIEKYTNYQTNLRSILYEYHGNCLIRLPLCSRDFSSFYKNLVSGGFAMAGSAAGGSMGSGAINGVLSAANTFLDGPDIQRSGAYSGSASAMTCRTPYIVVTRACQQKPANYSKYIGYPSFITYKLSELSGFTSVENVIDNTVIATDAEKAEIESLLKEGVYL